MRELLLPLRAYQASHAAMLFVVPRLCDARYDKVGQGFGFVTRYTMKLRTP